MVGLVSPDPRVKLQSHLNFDIINVHLDILGLYKCLNNLMVYCNCLFLFFVFFCESNYQPNWDRELINNHIITLLIITPPLRVRYFDMHNCLFNFSNLIASFLIITPISSSPVYVHYKGINIWYYSTNPEAFWGLG